MGSMSPCLRRRSATASDLRTSFEVAAFVAAGFKNSGALLTGPGVDRSEAITQNCKGAMCHGGLRRQRRSVKDWRQYQQTKKIEWRTPDMRKLFALALVAGSAAVLAPAT